MRLERSIDFWWPIFEAPECQAAHCGLTASRDEVEAFLQVEGVKPLVGEHGGYIFVPKDATGLIYELHSLFRKPGWGREAAKVGKSALRHMFGEGMQVLLTQEIQGLQNPPLSYGWVKAHSDFRELPIGSVRIWVLTRDAWEQSPAVRFARSPCQSFPQ